MDADKQLHSIFKMSLKHNCVQTYIVKWFSFVIKEQGQAADKR